MRLIELLKEKKLTISTVESCTGGLIGAKITSVSGASAVYKMGFITYSNESKIKLVGVSPKTLDEYSAVSSQTAVEMSMGGKAASGADVSISVTGFAGPEGDEVGLVFIGVNEIYKKFKFNGNRDAIREKAADEAILLAEEYIVKNFY